MRKPDTPPFGRCGDSDFYALTAYYADLDDHDAVMNAKARYQHCPPSFVVITGQYPYVRAQLWWRLEEPIDDPEICRRQNIALALALAGDTSVVNPGRLMRLAGSIAWPVKDGRQIELTSLTMPGGA